MLHLDFFYECKERVLCFKTRYFERKKMTMAPNGVRNKTAHSPGTCAISRKSRVPGHPSEVHVVEWKSHPLGLCISSLDAWLLSILVTLNTHIGRLAQIIHSHKL